MNKGTVTQIFGAVVDIKFEDQIPPILNALKFHSDNNHITFEVAQHLGDGIVRALAMNTTNGLKRGDIIVDTGNKILVPVGKKTLGRIIDVIGNPIDNNGSSCCL